MSEQNKIANTQIIEQLQNLLAGTNFKVQIVSYVSNGTANTEDTITLDGGRVPRGFLVIKRDKAGVFYAGGTADTTTTLHVKCSVATVTATLLVIFS